MKQYYVNQNAQDHSRGEHEVHDWNAQCDHPPDMRNRVDLGWHANCQSALAAAEAKGYRPADGCYYCVPVCHTT